MSKTKQSNADRFRNAMAAEMSDVIGIVADQNQQTASFSRAKRSEWPTLEFSLIQKDPDQPRKHFDEASLQELAESILKLGLMEPLRVRQGAHAREWIITDGERRYRAMEMLLQSGHDQFQSVPVLIDEAADTPEARVNLRLQQISTSWQKKQFTTLETAGTMLEIASMMAEMQGCSPDEITVAQIAEASGFHHKNVERHLKVGRGFTMSERAAMMRKDGYPDVGLDPLEGLVSWFNSPAGIELDGEGRLEVIEFFIKEKPSRKSLPLVLRPYAVKKRAGRLPAARFKAEATRTAGIEVSIRVPPTRIDLNSLDRTERKLEEALVKIKQMKAEVRRS